MNFLWYTAPALLGTWFSHRYAWWRPTVPLHFPRVLMYHLVRNPIKGSRYNKLRVSPEKFDQQLRWLNEEGWHFQFASQLLNPAPGKLEKRVIITFDDGYEDNLTNALPLLEKHNAVATLFLVADRKACLDWPAQRKAARAQSDLSKEKRLSDEQVRNLIESGRFEIGSHTITHPDLTTLEHTEKIHQLQESKRQLEDKFGVPVNTFCYPFGLYSPRDPEQVENAGYSLAFTTEQGIATVQTGIEFEWPRVKVSGTEGLYAFGLRMRTGFRGLKRR